MQNSILLDDSNGQTHKILVIGQAEKAVITTELPRQIQVQFCTNILDALTKITAETFELIAIVLTESSQNIKSSVRTIRKIHPETKIVLLAKMHQEPEAAKMVNAEKNADDYAICPVSFALTKNEQSYEQNDNGNKDRDSQKQKIEILEKLVMEDELTRVKNRRFVTEFLRQIIEKTANEDIQITVLVFDIDNFKEYNDRYGHQVGDSILKQAAVLMQKCCRKQDVVARIGGDEFAVVFWNVQEKHANAENTPTQTERRNFNNKLPSEAEVISERFRDELNKTDLPALGAYGKGTLTISGGLAKFPDNGKTAQQLLAQADAALLDAKRNGKNRVSLVGKDI